jgi:hypothetical protein
MDERNKIAALKSLDDMLKLERDWDGYGSEAPNIIAVDLAKRTIMSAYEKTFPWTNVLASVQEGVAISFTTPSNKTYAYVETYNVGEITALVCVNGQIRSWDIPPAELDQHIENIRNAILR